MGSCKTSAASSYLSFVLLFILLPLSQGCASMSPLAWPGAPPHAISLRLTGPEADNAKRTLCEQIAMDAGAMVTERAPIVATLSLGSKNQLTIATGQKVLYDEPRPHWLTKDLCQDTIRRVAALYPRGSLQDFVDQHVLHDPALGALISGAAHAQTAFNMAAETPIDELEEDSDRYTDLIKVINTAQDAYRRYASYGRTLPSATLDTAEGGVLLPPDFDGKIPLPGSGALLRVSTGPGVITLLGIESERGRTIVSFDGSMKATVALEFRPYLVGDRVDVSGVIKRKVRRGVSSAPAAAPASPVAPVSAAGCSKDTDCKGDRICDQGNCVAPSRKSGR